MNHKQRGFGIIEVVLVIAILAIIGVIAWRMLDSSGNGGTNTQPNQDTSTSESSSEEVAPIANQNDLTKVEEQLDGTKLEDSSSTELESETNF